MHTLCARVCSIAFQCWTATFWCDTIMPANGDGGSIHIILTHIQAPPNHRPGSVVAADVLHALVQIFQSLLCDEKLCKGFTHGTMWLMSHLPTESYAASPLALFMRMHSASVWNVVAFEQSTVKAGYALKIEGYPTTSSDWRTVDAKCFQLVGADGGWAVGSSAVQDYVHVFPAVAVFTTSCQTGPAGKYVGFNKAL